MAGNDATMSTADSAQRDVQSAIKMGQDTARTAKTVAKVASQAAAGNFAGAAVDLLKDPETVKKILLILLIPVLFVALLTVFFLHALPTVVYEAVVSFFSELGENWRQGTYGDDSGVIWAGIKSSISVAGDAISDVAASIWNGLVSLFTSDGGDDISDGTDTLTTDGIELHVTQDEAAQKETLERKIAACILKIERRQEQIKKAIQAQTGNIQSYFATKYAGVYDEWGGTTVDIHTLAIPKPEAIKLLSIYTVMTEASTADLKLSDFMQWLGYYSEFTSQDISFDLGGHGINGTVTTWQGTFMPQYLVEQRLNEIDEFGEEKTNFTSYSCAAVDMLLIVDCPNFSTLTPTVTEEKRMVTDEDAEPLEDGSQPQTEITVLVGRMTVPIVIRARSVDSLSKEVIGFWDGKLITETDLVAVPQEG